MPTQVTLRKKFSEEFTRLKQDQQDKVMDFVFVAQTHGMSDFSKFPGKVTPSWKNLSESSQEYAYTYENCLWHYHVGLPTYRPSVSGNYQTSDWVLHFQWLNRGGSDEVISLVDLYQHLTCDGKFWLPKPEYLEE